MVFCYYEIVIQSQALAYTNSRRCRELPLVFCISCSIGTNIWSETANYVEVSPMNMETVNLGLNAKEELWFLCLQIF